MTLSNIERQRRYRAKARHMSSRVDLRLPSETPIKLEYLAQHWQCTKTEALARLLLDTRGSGMAILFPVEVSIAKRYTVTMSRSSLGRTSRAAEFPAVDKFPCRFPRQVPQN